MTQKKTFGLTMVVTLVMGLAFAGVATATTITSPEGPTVKIHFQQSNGHLELHNATVNIQCEGTWETKIESHGSGVTATGKFFTHDWKKCTNGWIESTVSVGTIELHSIGGGDATITTTGQTLEFTRFGITCSYRTENTHIGTLTGGSSPTVHIEGNIPRHGGSFLCGGASAAFTGGMAVTAPSTLTVDS